MVLALAALLLGQSGSYAEVLDGVFSSGKSAYMLSSSICVSDSMVTQAVWSADSSKLAFIRTPIRLAADSLLGAEEPATVKTEVVVWNARTKSSRTLLTLNLPARGYGNLEFLGNSEIVYTCDTPTPTGSVETLYIAEYGSSAFSRWTLGPQNSTATYASGSNPFVLLTSESETGELKMSLLNSRGLVRTVALGTTKEKLSKNYVPRPDISADGKTASFLLRAIPGSKPTLFEQIEIDLQSGISKRYTGPLPDLGHSEGEEKVPAFELKSERSKGIQIWKLGGSAEGDLPPALVTSDGDRVRISPSEKFLSFISHGALIVRTITPIDLAQAKMARLAALKTKIITQAKQVATAMMMYSADADDAALPNSSEWKTILDPYLKDSSLTEGFEYTFQGSDFSKVEKPAETILGYVEGPGGRAVAYVDGHVKWINNP